MTTQQQVRLLVQSEMSNESKKLIETPVTGSNNDSFNFDLWAKAVRPQLLAALQKRTTKS